MFVVNFKLDFKKIFFACIAIAAIIATLIEFGSNNLSISTSKNQENYDYILTEENYTEILKQVHENIDENLGKTVKMSGFIFKMPDFKDGYFVCGRNTVIDNENQVAGFLCNHAQSSKFVDNEWIEITGTFVKGFYSCDMPVIKVETCTKISAPANSFVDPPTI